MENETNKLKEIYVIENIKCIKINLRIELII